MGDIYTNPPQSRNEAMVEAIINGTEYTDPPQSRNEAILKSIIDDTEYTEPPQSRMEDLLIQLKDASTGGEITLLSIPTYTDSMTYNGTEQTAQFNNYDAEKMTVTGNKATNAGTYTAVFTPNKGCYWNNGDGTATNEPKSVSWSIAKATNTITASPNTIALDTTTLYQDVTITQTGVGTLSVVSGDTSVATVGELSGGVVRVTGIDNGTTTITVSATETENYEAGTLNIPCAVQFIITQGIFGVYWDGLSTSTNNTSMTRTDDAENFVDPIAYVNDGDGSSPFDNIMPWAGMEIVQDEKGGELVKIPKFWVKITRTGTTDLKIQISPTAQTGFFVSPAHQDRGDGQGERDFVYVGRYLTGYDGVQYYNSNNSVYGYDTSGNNMKSKIEELGSEFAPLDIMTLWTIRFLYIVEFADWNSRKTIGNGKNTLNEAKYRSEALYHTGTNAQDRDSEGLVQYRYLKNIFDTSHVIAGLWSTSREIWLDKKPMNCFTNNNTASATATKIFSSSYLIGGSAYPVNFTIIPNYEWLLIPSISNTLTSGPVACAREWHYSSSLYMMIALWYGSTQYYPNSNSLFSEKNELSKLEYGGMYRIQKLPNNS